MYLSDYLEHFSKENREGRREPQTSCTSLEMVGWELQLEGRSLAFSGIWMGPGKARKRRNEFVYESMVNGSCLEGVSGLSFSFSPRVLLHVAGAANWS